MSNCFWTDLRNAEQVCGGGASTEQEVDAFFTHYSELAGAFTSLLDWAWKGAVLFSPTAPAESPAPPHWVPASTQAASDVIVTNSYVALPETDWDFDGSLCRVSTAGHIYVPLHSTTGGQGPYDALNFFVFMGNIDLSHYYGSLPTAYKFPPWVSEFSAYAPPRRAYAKLQLDYNIEVAVSAAATNVSLYDGDGAKEMYRGPGDVVNINEVVDEGDYFARDYMLAPEGFRGATYPSGSTASFGITGSVRPPGAAPSFGLNGHIERRAGFYEPSVIAAYVDDMEFFDHDSVPYDYAGYTYPPVGSGVSFGHWRAPVWYNDFLGEYVIGSTYSSASGGCINSAFDESDLPIRSPGFIVGSLRDAETEQIICRVAMRISIGG